MYIQSLNSNLLIKKSEKILANVLDIIQTSNDPNVGKYGLWQQINNDKQMNKSNLR